MGRTDCAACGKAFTSQRADALYCSNRCRQRRYRQGLSAYGAGRPRVGVSEEARQLGVSRHVLYRARKMAGLSPAAKDEAIRHGLTTATKTLLRAAGQGDPAEQVKVIQEEYNRRLRTPGSHLRPRLKAGR